MESKRWSLNKEDLKKIAIGAAMALIGALLSYLTEIVGQIDLGQWTPVVVSGWSILANVIRKLIAGA
jgi:hypothetical protein